MQERKREKSSIGSIAFFALSLLICVYFLSIIITTQIEINSKEKQLFNVQGQVLSQQIENDELQRALDTDSEEEYIERVAREKLGYSLPDERIYVDMSGN